MWQALIGPLVGLAKDYFQRKSEETKAVHEAKMAKITQEGTWEDTMAQGSLTSWKDEWFTVVLSVPLLAVGYGVAMDEMTVVDRLRESFVVLGTLPDWYQYLLYVAVLASFGIRGADKLMEMRK